MKRLTLFVALCATVIACGSNDGADLFPPDGVDGADDDGAAPLGDGNDGGGNRKPDAKAGTACDGGRCPSNGRDGSGVATMIDAASDAVRPGDGGTADSTIGDASSDSSSDATLSVVDSGVGDDASDSSTVGDDGSNPLAGDGGGTTSVDSGACADPTSCACCLDALTTNCSAVCLDGGAPAIVQDAGECIAPRILCTADAGVFACVAVADDPANCGGCGIVCPSDVCVSGICVGMRDDGGSASSPDAAPNDDGGSAAGDDASVASDGGDSGSVGDDGSFAATDGSGGGDDGSIAIDASSGSPDAGVADDGPTSDGTVGDDGSAGLDGGADAAVDGGRSCVLTQGYWRNHPDAWPTSLLSFGSATYSEAQCLTILEEAPRHDASLILAHQLIATLLNGGATDPNVSAYVTLARTWFSTNGTALPYGTRPSSSAGQQAVDLAAVLDAYNNGKLGTPHCD